MTTLELRREEISGEVPGAEQVTERQVEQSQTGETQGEPASMTIVDSVEPEAVHALDNVDTAVVSTEVLAGRALHAIYSRLLPSSRIQ